MSTAIPSYPSYEIRHFAIGMVREVDLCIPDGAVECFMKLSGDMHPLHAVPEFARSRGFRDRVCHGLLVAAYVSPFIAREFVGAHGLFVSFQSRFEKPVYEGDRICLRGSVEAISLSTGMMQVAWQMLDEAGVLRQTGTAGCMLPCGDLP